MKYTSELRHRVAFHETDAMGIVHHANCLRWFEEARVQWLEEHDQPYRAYLEQDLHFAVIRVEVDYHQSIRFDDRIAVAVWLDRLGGASLGMSYRVTRGDELLVSGRTEHAVIDGSGRVRRIPKDRRAKMKSRVRSGSAGDESA